MALYGRIKKFREPILHPESGVRYEWIPDKWISKRDKKDTPLRELEINFHAVKKHIAFIVVSFTSSFHSHNHPGTTSDGGRVGRRGAATAGLLSH